MTPERIAQLRALVGKAGATGVTTGPSSSWRMAYEVYLPECLDEIERLQAAQFTQGQASSLANAVRMDERRAIAAWLRSDDVDDPSGYLKELADDVESGDYMGVPK